MYTMFSANRQFFFIFTEEPAQNPDLHIKTYGPYSKWEHTYTFSENGDTATDISKECNYSGFS